MNAFPAPLSKAQAIAQVASQLTDPIHVDEFVRRVITLWPSKAKNPKAGIRQTLQYDFLGKSLLFLDEQTLLPMHLAMAGVRFRVSLARQEIERGWLFVYPAFQFMARQEVSPKEFLLEEADGRSLPVNLVTVKAKVKTFFGVQDLSQTAFDLKGWYKKHAFQRGDSLLVTVLDWETSRFRLEPEPTRLRQPHKAEIQTQNQALAEHLFQQLETARYEEVWGQIAIPTAYLRLKSPNVYPADHWLEVLEQDPRMKWTGSEIRYADWISPLEERFSDQRGAAKPAPSPRPKPLSKQEVQQVYRFKAALWHNKSLWRQIEIQGGQTLAAFDDILRTAFQHDSMDHLSGFWQLVRRGRSRNFREVDLGNINPFGGGEAAPIQIASLSLNPGDALKYVYDFGDWIQHRLELEALVEPEDNASYPRITGQNKPRYRHCQVCKDEGRKSVAAWVCYTCSDEEQSAVFLCEKCLNAHNEDHYLEEILY
jgi:hypothetical protein